MQGCRYIVRQAADGVGLRLAQDVARIARQDDHARQGAAGDADEDFGDAVGGDRPGVQGMGRALVGDQQHRVPPEEYAVGREIA